MGVGYAVEHRKCENGAYVQDVLILRSHGCEEAVNSPVKGEIKIERMQELLASIKSAGT